jgi:hypothetical protein
VANSLDVVRRLFLVDTSNPLHTMLRWAGCSLGDIEQTLQRDGLEATLEILRRDGIYLSHEEFKGKKPIVRSGQEAIANPGSFRNPVARGGMETTSSGSRSTGTITRPGLEFQIYREAQDAVFLKQFISPSRVMGSLLPILPSTFALNRLLACMRIGAPVELWFTLAGSLSNSGHYQIMTQLLVVEARLLGIRFPFAHSLPQQCSRCQKFL